MQTQTSLFSCRWQRRLSGAGHLPPLRPAAVSHGRLEQAISVDDQDLRAQAQVWRGEGAQSLAGQIVICSLIHSLSVWLLSVDWPARRQDRSLAFVVYFTVCPLYCVLCLDWSARQQDRSSGVDPNGEHDRTDARKRGVGQGDLASICSLPTQAVRARRQENR